ncbi:MAG TPA: hypothetical protein VGI56_07405 [Galbitalea sp.]
MSENRGVRRDVIPWLVGFVGLAAAFVAVIAILNGTMYSASGFVSSYIDALNRHDAATAATLPGVHATKGVSTALLTDDALGTIANVKLASDKTGKDGTHAVTYSYTLGGRRETSTFEVSQKPAFLGLFSRWSFARSPLATVSVSALHDQRFRANGTEVTSPTTHGTPSSYLVFAPGLYVFDHKSTFLAASPIDAAVTEPGSVTPVQVNVQANAEFVADVKMELSSYFTKCATQKVLLPTSCPFGKSFSNRVVSTPEWSMVKKPPVTIVPDGNTGKWLVPNAAGAAHLKVKVQSLFDGSISTFNADVPFDVSYDITIGANNHLTITALDG